MKKTIIALAALSAISAFAQSSVTISGVIDAGYKATSAPITATNVNSKSEINNNNTATSGLFFKGAEDLGGGLKANFLLELDLNVTSSQGAAFQGTPFNGEQSVSLSGAFGEVKLGTPNSSALTASSTSQPFGTAMGSGYSSTFGRLGSAGFGINQTVAAPSASNRIVRMEKTFMYVSPVISGFTGTLEYSFGNDNTTSAAPLAPATVGTLGTIGTPGTLGTLPTLSTAAVQNNEKYAALSIAYNLGALNAIYSYSTVNVGTNQIGFFNAVSASSPTGAAMSTLTANSTIAYNMLAANYTFGPATVYAGYTTTKSDAAVAQEDATSWNIAGKYAVTPAVELLANYLVRTSNLTTANNAKEIGLGANYILSKRTNLYARYELVDLNTDSKVASAGGSVTTGAAFGVKHTF